MESKSVIFNIEKCNSTRNKELNLPPCKTDDEIANYVRDVELDTWVTFRKMNFSDKIGEPNFIATDIFDAIMLNADPNHIIERNYMYLRKNFQEMEDTYYPFEYFSYEGDFYDVGKQFNRPLVKVNKEDKNLLAQSIIVLTSESRQYERKIYSSIDLLGDLGGVIEIIMISFGFIFFPISQHSYNLEATKRLFLANTSDDNLF